MSRENPLIPIPLEGGPLDGHQTGMPQPPKDGDGVEMIELKLNSRLQHVYVANDGTLEHVSTNVI